MRPDIETQCANMFAHMKAIVEAGGGTTDDIIKVTIWLKDRTQRSPVNVEWLKMFPDEESRPARHALQMEMDGVKEFIRVDLSRPRDEDDVSYIELKRRLRELIRDDFVSPARSSVEPGSSRP